MITVMAKSAVVWFTLQYTFMDGGAEPTLESALRFLSAVHCSAFAVYPAFGSAAPRTDGRCGSRRRRSLRWTPEEQQFVLNGYCRFGQLWTEMLKEYPFAPSRINYDLRDKWENIMKHAGDPLCRRLFECLERRCAPPFLRADDGAAGDAARERAGSVRARTAELVSRHFDRVCSAGAEQSVESELAAMGFS